MNKHNKLCNYYNDSGNFYFILDNGLEYKLYREDGVLVARTQLLPKRFLIKRYNLKFIPIKDRK